MKTLICKSCQHPKGQHDSNGGCFHMSKEFRRCICMTKRSDNSQFVTGTPSDD